MIGGIAEYRAAVCSKSYMSRVSPGAVGFVPREFEVEKEKEREREGGLGGEARVEKREEEKRER